MIDVYHSVTSDGINSSVAAILFSEFMLQCLYFININIFFTCKDSCEKQMLKNMTFDNFCFKNIVMTYYSNVEVLFGQERVVLSKLNYLVFELIIGTLIECIGYDALKTANKIMIHFL